MTSDKNKTFFTRKLLNWNINDNKRLMPWKGEKDPYKIWLSEIILQQTRVEQGLDYYNRFIAAFPTVNYLAKASETKVFKLWEGLGYYTRCKNLIATAKFIAGPLKGKFPHKYEDILELKGIGPYTAAAIASFAFNLPHAVVDGNVFRVLSRYFRIDLPIDSAEGKKHFSALAEELLDKKKPAMYNQALMDFGAVICKPQLPLCINCPLKSKCVAYLDGLIDKLPVKEKKIVKKTRWFYYLVIEFNGKTFVRKRGAKDIWENLYEFVLIENETALATEKISQHPEVKKIFAESPFEIIAVSQLYQQQLTHQTLRGQFIIIKPAKEPVLKGFEAVNKRKFNSLPFPRFIAAFLKEKNVSLNLF